MQEGAAEARDDPRTAGPKGMKSDWNPTLETGPRREFVREVLKTGPRRQFMREAVKTGPGREFVREVLAQKVLSDISSRGCVPAQWLGVSSSPGREGPGTTRVCRLENRERAGNHVLSAAHTVPCEPICGRAG